MFGSPERTNDENDVRYYVSVTRNEPIGVKYELIDNAIVPNVEHQSKLIVFKNAVLSELANHSQMFKKPPTLEYLQAITPNWGCIINDNVPQWNPYTQIQNKISKDQQPCYVDFNLTGLFISRSTISPQFEAVFVEKMQESNLIDIEWAANPIVPEVEEISDISLPSAGFIELRDPAVLEKMKAEAKESVKAAFQKASLAKDEALEMAKQFANKFDVSDNESMFSEWLEDSGSESEDTPEIAVKQS